MSNAQLINQIEQAFSYQQAGSITQNAVYQRLRDQAKVMAQTIANECPSVSREFSLFMTNLEQAIMWGTNAVARSGTQQGVGAGGSG